MKIAATAFSLLAVVAVIWLILKLRGPRDLTAGEVEIRQLVREVYGTNIVREEIVPHGADMALAITLQNEKVLQLQLNPSSLARKHQDGVSLLALKASLRFE